ncbi:MAG TPA: hypothetical protein VLZ74_13470 [Methylocella sp.]|nr:hypothetical protein [Methylocella sp.]
MSLSRQSVQGARAVDQIAIALSFGELLVSDSGMALAETGLPPDSQDCTGEA